MTLIFKIYHYIFRRKNKTFSHEAYVESQKAVEEFRDMKAKALIGR